MNKKVSTKEWLDEAKKIICKQKHCTRYVVMDESIVIVYDRRLVDETKCKALGYKVYEAYNNGGVIVANNGDIELGHFGELNNDFLKSFCDYFVSWLKTRGLNVELVNNDILVDGFKVCGTCVTRYNKIDYTGVHIGINTNVDHIKAICEKPMRKIPKGLSDYGITTDEVEQMFLDFCKKRDSK